MPKQSRCEAVPESDANHTYFDDMGTSKVGVFRTTSKLVLAQIPRAFINIQSSIPIQSILAS